MSAIANVVVVLGVSHITFDANLVGLLAESSMWFSPRSQLDFLPLVIPPCGFCRVAESICPAAFPLQLALVWPHTTRYPCVQQYPIGSRLAIHAVRSNGGRLSLTLVSVVVAVVGVAVARILATRLAFVASAVSN